MHAVRERVAALLFGTAAVLCVVAVVLICLFLVINGAPALIHEGIIPFVSSTTWQPATDHYGILAMVVGSLYVTAGALIFGVPLGLLTAIYLSRFASPRIRRLFQPLVELLAGIPSVVYGFFGLVVIVPLIRQIFSVQGMGVLAASLVLGIMILPTIVTVSLAALDAVPPAYYEGARAIGASHERCVFTVIVPAALSGIVASVILSFGRAIGETMAVVMVVGNNVRLPTGILEGVRTMTANIVLEMGYAADLHRSALIATALVLFVFILAINLLFSLVRKRVRS
ncbi:MAG: phosphate ABC transporter permease subunit PstC [Coriobacteriales bacterium]|jgi:phosphate transport system permease protein|nr:phosphate ABC transporter permease subunit PstC [Coriobacteriales bacterium]